MGVKLYHGHTSRSCYLWNVGVSWKGDSAALVRVEVGRYALVRGQKALSLLCNIFRVISSALKNSFGILK